MSNRREHGTMRSDASALYRTFAVLVAATALLAALALWPRPARLTTSPTPLAPPIVLDEPVVHLWK